MWGLLNDLKRSGLFAQQGLNDLQGKVRVLCLDHRVRLFLCRFLSLVIADTLTLQGFLACQPRFEGYNGLQSFGVKERKEKEVKKTHLSEVTLCEESTTSSTISGCLNKEGQQLRSRLVTEEELRVEGSETKSNESTPHRLNFVSLVSSENQVGSD